MPDPLNQSQRRLNAIERQRMSDDWWTEFMARAVAVGLGSGFVWGLWEIVT